MLFRSGPTFPSPASGSGVTDANGQTSFCFTASLPGQNVIHAFADSNGNTTEDAGEPFGDATWTWTPPASTQFCTVTINNGGWITAANGDKATMGGSVTVGSDGTPQGSEGYRDHGPVSPLAVSSTKITATTCSADRTVASIFGEATINGSGTYVFRIDVEDGDNASPPTSDRYGITLSNGYQSGFMPLGGGNVKIH